MDDAKAAIEAVMRNSYGRLIAYLAARTGDVAGAEDALSDALAAALQKWPMDGVPDNPDGWLLRVARNRLIDTVRRSHTRLASEEAYRRTADTSMALDSEVDEIPDERLKLLFVCAHPAIDASARTPLMLQAVLGVDAARIASAFLISPAAMSQRLVRVKKKIRAAGIPFVVPGPAEWDERLSFVLDAIYSAYTAGWDSVNDIGSTQHALAEEALWIGRTLVQLMPEEPEARGLLSLMLHCQARKEARFGPSGEFVPLDQQDPELWDASLIAEAESHLRHAASANRMGRFQLEAAIQSIHAHRAHAGTIDWPQIALLYEGLARIAPSIGSLVGRAVAMAEAGQHDAGFAALEEIPRDQVASYQPYWAARGHLLLQHGQSTAAKHAFLRAASLTDDPALKDYLYQRSTQA